MKLHCGYKQKRFQDSLHLMRNRILKINSKIFHIKEILNRCINSRIFVETGFSERWLMVNYYFTPWEFFTSALADGYHGGLSDSKSLQVSRTLLSILGDHNNVVVWTVSTNTVISKSSNPCTNHLLTVPRAPITFGIIVTFMFYSFFTSPKRCRYIFLFTYSFNFTLLPAGTAKSIILQVICFLLIIIRSSRLAEIRWPVCIQKFQKSLCISFSRTDSRRCIYYYLLIRGFHISVSWWSFTGDWVTASLLTSSELFSVFWYFSIMLLF